MSLLRGPSALPRVAREAAGDDIVPDRLASLSPRDHVVVVQLATGLALPTVLALEVVAGQDVDPGELHPLFAHRDVLLDPSHGWHLEGHGRGRDFYVILFQYLDLPLDKLADRILPVDYSVGLHPGVEQ